MHSLCALLLAAVAAAVPRAQDPPGRIEGQVRGPLGELLPNVEVWASHEKRGGAVLARARSDAEGTFVLGKLPVERPVFVLARAPSLTTALAKTPLSAERAHAYVQLRLWHANTLRGRVVDGDGKALAGAQVLGTKDATYWCCDFLPPEVLTDADGKFELAGVPIGACVLRAYHGGRAFRQLWLTATADGDVTFPPLRADDGTALAVQVNGVPAGSRDLTRVLFCLNTGSAAMPSSIESPALDASGRVELRGLLDGEWYVEADVPGLTCAPRRTQTKLGVRDNSLEFAAIGPTRLTGTLRTSAGKPLGNRLLRCSARTNRALATGVTTTATSADGRFAFDAPLADGEAFRFELSDRDWVLDGNPGPVDPFPMGRVQFVGEARAGAAFDLVAIPGSVVSARLVDTEGRPVPFAACRLESEERNGQWLTAASATSARDGSVTFPAVRGGERDLRITVYGTLAAGTSPVFVVGTDEDRNIDVEVPLAGNVAGRVVDASGQPCAGATVSLRNFDARTSKPLDGAWTNVATDREGRFVFTGVTAGGHRVDVDRKRNGVGAVSDVFDVAPGAAVKVDLCAK